MKKINYHILGASGHIGSKLIRNIPCANDAEITINCIDDMRTQRFCSYFSLPDNYSYKHYFCDARDYIEKTNFLEDDIIINLAAITDAESSVGKEDELKRNNLGIVECLVNNKKLNNIKKIFFSSTSVYGSQDKLVDENCNELVPQSPYASSKIDEENTILGSNTSNYIIFRFGTIFGHAPGIRFHTAVNKFCFQASYGMHLTVWRSAINQKRPYLDIDDAISAINFFIDKGLDNQIYNVVTHNLSVQQIIDEISLSVTDLQVDLVDSKIMNQLSYEVDDSKIREKGFTPSGNLKNKITETIQILTSHR